MPPETTLADLLDALDSDIGTLERYAIEVSWELFVSSRDDQNKVLFGLHRAIQGSLDAAAMVVAARRLGPASGYRDVFARLAEAGVLETGLAQRLYGWAGLRDVIVHLYRILDLERLHKAYTEETGDLRGLLAALVSLPEASPGGSHRRPDARATPSAPTALVGHSRFEPLPSPRRCS